MWGCWDSWPCGPSNLPHSQNSHCWTTQITSWPMSANLISALIVYVYMGICTYMQIHTHTPNKYISFKNTHNKTQTKTKAPRFLIVRSRDVVGRSRLSWAIYLLSLLVVHTHFCLWPNILMTVACVSRSLASTDPKDYPLVAFATCNRDGPTLL